MTNSLYLGPLQPLSEKEELLGKCLKKHVEELADQIGERNVWHYRNLEDSANYIERVFADIGYKVGIQEFKVDDMTVGNLEVELTGTSLPAEIVLVGAHYDSVIGSPGANDNASGVAALLEIARHLVHRKLSRTVRLVAFVNEEPPFFRTTKMGSRAYARRARQRKEQIVAMLALETIGYYSEAVGSQRYPFPFSFFYPKTGNFIGFVGNISSRHLLRRAIAIFREQTNFPCEGLAAPGWMTGIGWSDHSSFWKEGYPAIMLTDTALFRYQQYHKPEDTPDKVDYARMARVVTGVIRTVSQLASANGIS
jgi:Zn-dependent M28 family amino/carboxypeptidase